MVVASEIVLMFALQVLVLLVLYSSLHQKKHLSHCFLPAAYLSMPTIQILQEMVVGCEEEAVLSICQRIPPYCRCHILDK